MAPPPSDCIKPTHCELAMAAFLGSYQSEGISFAHHSSEEASPGFEDPEPDDGEIVKSKPRNKQTSYLPLVDEAPYSKQPDLDERSHVYSEGEVSEGEKLSCGPDGNPHSHRQGVEGAVPLNGRIPTVDSIGGQCESSPIASRGVTKRGAGGGAEKKQEEDGDGMDDLEDSTTALIRRYTMQRNGRPTSIHLGPSGEIVGSGWLSEILVTNHKKCAVTLEEDCITWQFLSRKEREGTFPFQDCNCLWGMYSESDHFYVPPGLKETTSF